MQIDLSPPDKALLGKEGLHPVVERVGVHMEGGHMVLPGESLREGEQRGGHPLPLDGRVHRQAVDGIDLSPVLPGDEAYSGLSLRLRQAAPRIAPVSEHAA